MFDLNDENSGVNITNKDIHKGLFGFIKENIQKDEIILNELTEADIEKLNPMEKKELFDKLLDKGVMNLTENDKKIMPFLVK